VEFLSLLDVVGYNYVDRWRERKELYYSVDKAAHPNWRMIGTESSGMGGPRGDYRGMLPPAPGQVAGVVAPPAASPLAQTGRGGAPGGGVGGGPGGRGGAPGGGMGGFRGGRGALGLDTEQLWKFVRTHDYVAGDFMWTGIDYIGESGWPSRGSTSGCIDSCGFPKDGFYFYQSQWTDKPMLRLFPHWNWKGREGQYLTMACYTNCDSVELFLNGRSVGTKGFVFPRFGQGRATPSWQTQNGVRTTSDLHLAWDVLYEPGTLRAVGTRAGQSAVEVEIATTGDPAALQLSVDRDAIRADRRDVAHITARVVDAEGRMHPDADNEITFEIQGTAKLIGVDNGDMSNQEDFKGKQKKAFHGMCLAIVQSSGNAGQILVTAASPGLKPATVTISARG
jgi:beta-galactosidase